MRQIAVALLVLLALNAEAVSVAKSTDNDIVLKVSTDKNSSPNPHHFSGEWLESPWGDLYQFRAGSQSWLTAREHCLSLNADLAAIRNVEQLDWILSHYAPLSSRFAQRLVQIGLYAPEGQTHEWKWLNGEEINTTLQWSAGEPYDHSMEGRERCGLLSVEKRVLDDVDCESTPSDRHAMRYVCQRTPESHKQQQRSNNYIWEKIEGMLSFFGIGSPAPKLENNSNKTEDYEDAVLNNTTTSSSLKARFSDSSEETSSEEEDSVIKTLAALPKIEGSGESSVLKELEEGSGQIVEKKVIETLPKDLDEKKLDKMIDKMEEMIKSIDDLTVQRTTVATPSKDEVESNQVSANIEGDFDQKLTKDMPKADIEPPKDEDCEPEGSGSGDEFEKEEEEAAKKIQLAPEKEDKIKEFLGVLRLFLDRAEHGDLRKLLDDQSGKTLLERMKNAVREANKKEFEMLEIMESSNKNGEKEALTKKLKGDQMSSDEQKDLYKKISSAVMRAAKQHTVSDEPGMEKFEIAEKAIEKTNDEADDGTVELVKSAKESKPEKNRDKKEVNDESSASGVVELKEELKDAPKTDETTTTTAEITEDTTKTSEVTEKSTTTSEVTEDTTKTSEVTEETTKASEVTEETTTTSSEAPTTTELTKTEEPEASGEEDVTTTTESTTVAVKQVSDDEIEKLTKLETKGESDDSNLTTKTAETTTEPTSSESPTTPAITTTVTVAVKKVSEEEMDKLSKMEATEKVTLLPPLPNFTFPTIAPFTFPTIPTIAPTGSTVAPPKVPTLEEILGNLNNQFKKLLAPPLPK